MKFDIKTLKTQYNYSKKRCVIRKKTKTGEDSLKKGKQRWVVSKTCRNVVFKTRVENLFSTQFTTHLSKIISFPKESLFI